MALPEREQAKTPEIGKLIWVDPTELMLENPAAHIVNNESYQRMEAHFSPEQMDPPQVVRVKTFSSEHGEVTRLFVVDGLTRTKFASDHKGTVLADYPDFSFDSIAIRDVTISNIRNPRTIPFEERADDQKELTMIQYLRAVIPPTVEHSQIAPDRIAAHLINAWDNMVGEDIAKRFSALASLSLLANPSVPTATDRMFRDYLARQAELMAGETPDERVRLQQKLREMASVVRQSKLIEEEVAKSAFVLVSAASPVIGGEREARRQIYGLLHTPEVEGKLKNAFEKVVPREQARDNLGQEISQVLQRVTKTSERERITADIQDMLKDRALNYNQVLEILADPDPSKRYREIIHQINRDRLFRTYESIEKRKQFSGAELTLIDQLGRKTNLEDRDLGPLHKVIKEASEVIERTDAFVSNIDRQRQTLQKKGVSEQNIDEIIRKVGDLERNLLASDTAQALQRRMQELEQTAGEYERRVSGQVRIHTLGEIVDSVYGEELQRDFGPQVRKAIVDHIKNEKGLSNEALIRRRLQQLKGLDADLQSAVIADPPAMTIDYAIHQQAKRREAEARPPAPVSPVEPAQPKRLETPPAGPVFVTPPMKPEEVTPVRQRREIEERQQREIERTRLRNTAGQFHDTLREMILKHDDLTDAEKREIDIMLIRLGKLRFDHPDIVRVIEYDYPRLLGESIKAAQDKLHKE